MLKKKAPVKKAPPKKAEPKPVEAPKEHPGLAILAGLRVANQSDTRVYIMTEAEKGALEGLLR